MKLKRKKKRQIFENTTSTKDSGCKDSSHVVVYNKKGVAKRKCEIEDYHIDIHEEVFKITMAPSDSFACYSTFTSSMNVGTRTPLVASAAFTLMC